MDSILSAALGTALGATATFGFNFLLNRRKDKVETEKAVRGVIQAKSEELYALLSDFEHELTLGLEVVLTDTNAFKDRVRNYRKKMSDIVEVYFPTMKESLMFDPHRMDHLFKYLVLASIGNDPGVEESRKELVENMTNYAANLATYLSYLKYSLAEHIRSIVLYHTPRDRIQRKKSAASTRMFLDLKKKSVDQEQQIAQLKSELTSCRNEKANETRKAD